MSILKKKINRNNTNFPIKIYEELKKVKKEGTAYEFLKYHQNIVRHFVLNIDLHTKGLLVKHSMGTGKSLVAVSIIMDLLLTASKNPYNVIVLLTKSIKENFKGNIIKYVNLRKVHEPEFFLGMLSEEDLKLWIDKHFNFVTLKASNMIKQLIKATEGYKSKDMQKLEKKMGRLVDIGSLDNTCLVVDEAHHLFRSIVNGSKNGVRLYDLAMQAKNNKIIFMTGTPIEDDPFTLVPCFNMLAGTKLFPEDYTHFREYFVDEKTSLIKNKAKFQNRIFGLVSSVHHFDKPGKGVIMKSFNDRGAITESMGEDLGTHFPNTLPDDIMFIPMSQRQYQRYMLAREDEQNEAKQGSTQAVRLQKPKSAMTSSYRQKSRQLSNYCPPEKYYGVNFSAISPDDISDKECKSPKVEALFNSVESAEGISLAYSQFVGVGGLGIISRNFQSHGWKLYNETNISSILKEDEGGEPLPEEEVINDESADEPANDKLTSSRGHEYMRQFELKNPKVNNSSSVDGGSKQSINLTLASPSDISLITKEMMSIDEYKSIFANEQSMADHVRKYLVKPNFILLDKDHLCTVVFCEVQDQAVKVKSMIKINDINDMDVLYNTLYELLINDPPPEYKDIKSVDFDIKGLSKDSKSQLKVMQKVSNFNELNKLVKENPSDVRFGAAKGHKSSTKKSKVSSQTIDIPLEQSESSSNMRLVEFDPDSDESKEHITQLETMWDDGVINLKKIKEKQSAGQNIGAKILLKKNKVKAVGIYDYTDNDIVVHESFIKAPKYREIFYNEYVRYASQNKSKSPFNNFVYFKVKRNSNLDGDFYKQYGCVKIKESVNTLLYRCNLGWGCSNFIGKKDTCSDTLINGAGKLSKSLNLDSESKYIKDDYYDGLKLSKYNINQFVQIHNINPMYLSDDYLTYYISSVDDDVFGYIVLSFKDNSAVIEDMYIYRELTHKPRKEGKVEPKDDINLALVKLIDLIKDLTIDNGYDRITYYTEQELVHDFLNKLGFIKLNDNQFVLDIQDQGKLGKHEMSGTNRLMSKVRVPRISYNCNGGSASKKAKTFAIISGKVPPVEREQIIKVMNSKDNINGELISLLLISATGAEGLDLHNVRHVYIFESYWNDARHDQVGARAIRNDSHIELPNNKQNVQVHVLISVAPESEVDKDTDYYKILRDIVDNNNKNQYSKVLTTDLELFTKAKLSAKTKGSFTDAIDEVSIECVLNGRDHCKICKPNNRPLFMNDLREDLIMKDSCESFSEDIINAKEIEIDNNTYYYVEDKDANKFGVIAYEYNPDLASYVEIPMKSDLYQKIVEIINPEFDSLNELINKL